MKQTRRGFLASAAWTALAGSASARQEPKRTILLRSSWQTVNIGDIAHTPGVLRLLEQHLPGTTVVLWPSKIDRGVEPMLRRRFPQLRIVRDAPQWRNPQPRPEDPTLADAFRQADMFLHGSGPSLAAQADVQRWQEKTGKPWGAYGITIGNPVGSLTAATSFSPGLKKLLDTAAFLFTRETKSLEALRQLETRCPQLDFVPDGTFALDLRDDAAAGRLLAKHDLEPGRFLCAVPRLRLTPYWQIHPESKMAPEEIARRQAVNDKFAESDHAKLRAMIVAWVRTTGQRVLVCPEMTYQVDIIKPLVVDPLPDDVKARVVPLERYWLTDEAGAVYRQARIVVSMECHSPIMAIANGRPAFYLRQPTDTWKGQMYPDLGLGAWKLDLDTLTGAELTERLLQVNKEYDAALALVKQTNTATAERFTKTMRVVKQTLQGSAS